MHHKLDDIEKEEWVIWNGANGLVTTVTIERIEVGATGRSAWLDEPFNMVGPFDIDELETHGRINYAACIIMSRQRWQQDQLELRRESLQRRRAEEERLKKKYTNHNRGHSSYHDAHKSFNQQQHRETLKLPADGTLEAAQINAAYRRLAQKAHPDAGGSNKQFVRITDARNALLEDIS